MAGQDKTLKRKTGQIGQRVENAKKNAPQLTQKKTSQQVQRTGTGAARQQLKNNTQNTRKILQDAFRKNKK